MNSENKVIKIIDVLEKRLNLNCICSEMQTREIDETTFAHTIFRVKDEHKFAHILIVINDICATVLVSDKYSTNEIVDKILIKGDRICIDNNESIYELAI